MPMEIYPNLIDSIVENNKSALYELMSKTYSVDIAIVLKGFDDEKLLQFHNLVESKDMAQILAKADEKLQLSFLKLLDYDAIMNLFTYMSNDDIADIVGNLPIGMRKELLNMMKEDDISTIEELLGYEPDSAGGIMTTEYIALSGELTTEEALKKVKDIGPKTEVIETIFVIGNQKELIGTVDLRNILLSSDTKQLQDIMRKHIIYVHPEVDQEEVARLVSKYDLKAIPVINRNRALLGIITVDDIIDVIVEEHMEDMLRLGGVSKEERINTTLGTSIKKRLPWLLINLITAFLAAFTIAFFEDVIVQVVALAAVMPIIAGMGGNAGTQTLSVVIRSISLGEVELRKNWKLVLKEIGLGAVNGAITGIITGIILYIKYGNPYLGLIVVVSMIGNLVIAGFFGFLIPLVLKLVGADPALASAIFLTTATDVLGFFIFLGLAKMFLPLLI